MTYRYTIIILLRTFSSGPVNTRASDLSIRHVRHRTVHAYIINEELLYLYYYIIYCYYYMYIANAINLYKL